MAQDTGVFSYLISKLSGGKIVLRSVLTYFTHRELSTLSDEDLVTKHMLINAIAGVPGSLPRLKIPFAASMGFTITWATDIPPGQTDTYEDIFDDLVPNFIVWIGNDTDGYNQNGTTPQVNESSGVVSSVVFTFGVISSGYVRAN